MAVAAGCGLGLIYEPHDHPWLVLLAIPLFLATLNGVSMKGGFLVGSGFGIAYYLVLVPWIKVIGGDATIALAVLEGLFYGVFGALASQTLKHRLWMLWIPCLWVGTEFATGSVPFGGFPWARLAWAFSDSSIGRLAAYVGIAGLSFILALLGVLVYAVLRRRSAFSLRLVSLVVGVAIIGLTSLITLSTAGNGKTVTAAMVQGNVPGKGLEFLGRARTVTKNHMNATLDLEKQVQAGSQVKPDLVIWPENSTDIDPYKDAETRQDIETAVQAVKVPILVGAVTEGPGENERQTTGIVWDPATGPGQRYAKRHPVPFGEYIPFRDQLLPYIKRLEMIGRQTAPGVGPGHHADPRDHLRRPDLLRARLRQRRLRRGQGRRAGAHRADQQRDVRRDRAARAAVRDHPDAGDRDRPDRADRVDQRDLRRDPARTGRSSTSRVSSSLTCTSPRSRSATPRHWRPRWAAGRSGSCPAWGSLE